MLRRLLATLALISSAIAAPTAAHAQPASAACTIHKVGTHYECVHPGAFCAKAAHNKYGYSATHKKYRCVKDGSRWRWKPTSTTPAPATKKCSRKYLPLPDPKCQPGAYNPAVTQGSIKTTICVSGWTKTVRPSTSYTNALKTKQIRQYGYRDTNKSHYEEDHLVPLELGGSPKSAKNLWPEPESGPSPAVSKDSVENKLKKAVCAGTVTLAAARHAIAKNWTTALAKLGL
ncbi:hypothetical protein J5X84_43670 [Streptosporangiaceae bacterium NEAU-GS5]|nr:hypothetical protein [Streptosporangiaceae bacterium NEAU-GS5]